MATLNQLVPCIRMRMNKSTISDSIIKADYLQGISAYPKYESLSFRIPMMGNHCLKTNDCTILSTLQLPVTEIELPGYLYTSLTVLNL